MIQKKYQQYQSPIILSALILILISSALNLVASETFFIWLGFVVATLLTGLPIIFQALQSIRFHIISIELLVSIAVVGAFAIGEFSEAAIVTFLFALGNLLEQRAIHRARASIKALTDLTPKFVHKLMPNQAWQDVPVAQVDVGDQVKTKAGEVIAVDGEIIAGTGSVDESSLTGEAQPVEKIQADGVYSGTMLVDGALTIQVTQIGDDTQFAKIVALIETAQDTKSPAERFINRFAARYTPIVLLIAVVTFIATHNIRLAITVLVLGCPGALVVGAPVSNVVGIGRAARQGIVIKGGDIMTKLPSTEAVVFDKTGTLTTGNMNVTDSVYTVANESHVMINTMIKSIEMQVGHPIAKALVRYLDQQSSSESMLDVNHLAIQSGLGVQAEIGKDTILIGNQALMTKNQVKMTGAIRHQILKMQSQSVSLVYVAISNRLTAVFGVEDDVRPEAKNVIKELRQAGIKHVAMLTGDRMTSAQLVAKQLDISDVQAHLLPDDKVAYLRQLELNGQRTAFIGDGINDGPAIANAFVGIALGSGTDVAIETADIILPNANLKHLNDAYLIAKQTTKNMYENIFIAIMVVLFLFIGLFNQLITMTTGMFVHELSILVVIFNALRLVHSK